MQPLRAWLRRTWVRSICCSSSAICLLRLARCQGQANQALPENVARASLPFHERLPNASGGKEAPATGGQTVALGVSRMNPDGPPLALLTTSTMVWLAAFKEAERPQAQRRRRLARWLRGRRRRSSQRDSRSRSLRRMVRRCGFSVHALGQREMSGTRAPASNCSKACKR